MKATTILATALAIAATSDARAHNVTKNARSGQTALMWRYGSFQNDCSPAAGTIKVRAKPMHGRITQQSGTVTMHVPRFRENIQCVGATREGLLVYYTSEPEFRGVDSFSIEVIYPSHPTDVDTFSVHVR